VDPRQFRIIIMAGLCAMTFIAFGPALSAGFLSWDDPKNITGVPQVRALTLENLKWMFFDYGPDIRYKPLTYLTWALIHALFGLQPWPYHLANLLFHALAAVLLFQLLERIGAVILGPARQRSEANWRAGAAGVATLLWTVHPLRVETSCWATAVSYPQAVCFLCGSMLCFLRCDPARPFFRQGPYWAALGLFQLAMMCYPAAVGFSFAILAALIYPFGRIQLDSFKAAVSSESRRGWLEALPFFVLTAVMVAVGIYGQYVAKGEFGDPLTLEELPLADRLKGAIYFLAYYFWRPLYPLKMYTLNEDLIDLQAAEPRILLSALLLLAITLLAWVKRGKYPAGLALWIAFVGLTGPILKLTGGTPFPGPGDRYSMIPGLAWTAGLYGFLLCWRGHARRDAILAALLVVSLGLTIQSRARSRVWENDVTFFSDQAATLKSIHRVQALARWGKGLVFSGQAEEGLEKLGEAWREGAPYLVEEIGVAYPQLLMEAGRVAEAVPVLRQAAQLRPDSLEIRNLLGMALFQTGQWQEGGAVFEAMIHEQANTPQPFIAYALALAGIGQQERAAGVIQRGLQRFPGHPGLSALLRELQSGASAK